MIDYYRLLSDLAVTKYYLRTDIELTGVSEYVAEVIYTSKSEKITLSDNKEDAIIFNREEAIILSNRYPYLELERIECK